MDASSSRSDQQAITQAGYSGSGAPAAAPEQHDHVLHGGGMSKGAHGQLLHHRARGGVPSFAYPWIELGRLEERERWQGLAIELVETSIASELQELKRGLTDALSRQPDLRSTLSSKVDLSQSKISKLIGEYRKLFLDESSIEDLESGAKKAMLHALQCQGFSEETIIEMSKQFNEVITHEIVAEEIVQEDST